MPDGPQIFDPAAKAAPCAFCGLRQPDDEHLNTRHGIAKCLMNSIEERSFRRKDDLVQHLNDTHSNSLRVNPKILASGRGRDGNLSERGQIWECGFCDSDKLDWRQRCRHLIGHFKERANMTMWHVKDPRIRV